MDPQKTPVPQPQNGDLPEDSKPEAVPGVPNVEETGAAPSEVDATVGSQPETATSNNEPTSPEPDLPDSPTPAESQVDSSSLLPKDDSSSVIEDSNPDPLPVTAPTHRKKGLMIGLIVAVVLLLLSGAAAASYYYYESNKPENVLKQALANSFNLKKAATVHFNLAASAEDSGADMSADLSFKGAVDNKVGAFDISGKADILVTKVNLDFRSPDGKDFYVKVGGLKGLPELMSAGTDMASVYAPIVDSINDQWIEISSNFIKQYDKSYKSSVLTEADIKKFVDAYLENPFLVIKEVMADEVINGQKHHHYKIVIDATKLKGLLAALKDAKLDSYEINQETLETFNQSIDRAGFEKYPFEIWISKGDKMINQWALKFTEGTTTANLRLTVDSYNKPVKVEKPAGAKTIMEIISSFYTKLTGGAENMVPNLEGTGISL